LPVVVVLVELVVVELVVLWPLVAVVVVVLAPVPLLLLLQPMEERAPQRAREIAETRTMVFMCFTSPCWCWPKR
jgi:hypothetical protein